ncbi:MAG: PIN domain-containing protein [archaeon]|nr:PIN domain-containing protein [archaeon]
MSDEAFFFDTYAFFEIIEGKPSYEKYKKAKAITTIFNLAELNYALKREEKKYADEVTREYSMFLVDVNVEDIVNAMGLRIKNKKLSIPDAIGYTIAKKNNVKFLTGDKEFETMSNAEFVK